jgi:hypothetical protein
MVVSDSAKNVQGTRRKITTEWPWILTCPDPCHLLNLLAKDLILGSATHPKITDFANLMSIVSTFTTYFAHSNYGLYHLKEEMKLEPDKRGIVAAGGTRFSTFAVNAESVNRCWPAMKRCFTRQVLLFTTKGSATIKQLLGDEDRGDEFKSNLRVTIRILAPIRRGLLTLEGQLITVSDVFLVFLGVGVGFKRTFSDPYTSIYKHQKEAFAAFDRRFDFLMRESTELLFLVAYVLDPGKHCIVHSSRYSRKCELL